MTPRTMASSSSSSATPVRRKPSLDFSLTGLVYVCMMMFMGLAAINSRANLLFAVFGLMIGVLLVSINLSRTVLRRLHIERVLPEHAVVGQRAAISYRFRNDKRFWPSFSVSLGELDGCDAFVNQPYTYMLHAAAGTSAVVPTDVTLRRRGLYTLDAYQISTSFPFGFIKRALIAEQKDTLVVYPALGQVDRRLLALCRSAEKTGAMMRPRRGGLDEIYGLKEYRPGENPRWISWKRSARTGVLVSKEMTQVSPPRLIIMVDSHVPQRTAAAHAAVERAIAMAASLADHVLETNMAVGLYTWSGQWTLLAANRGKRHRREMLTTLARLPLNVDHPADDLLNGTHELMKGGSTLVLVTGQPMQMSLADRLRGGLLVVSGESLQGRQWFSFPKDLDFAHAMPPEQEPEEEKTEDRRQETEEGGRQSTIQGQEVRT